MIAAAIGAAMAKPSAMTHRDASNCGKVPENAAKPAPAVYRVSPVLKIVLRPMRSPARPKQSERLQSIIDPIKPIHWTAAKVASNSFWIAESDTLMLPTLCMWKNVPRQTTTRTRDSSLGKIEPVESKFSANSTVREQRLDKTALILFLGKQERSVTNTHQEYGANNKSANNHGLSSLLIG